MSTTQDNQDFLIPANTNMSENTYDGTEQEDDLPMNTDISEPVTDGPDDTEEEEIVPGTDVQKDNFLGGPVTDAADKIEPDESGDPMKVGIPPEDVEDMPLQPKSFGNTCQSGCRENVRDVVMVGEDLFKLLSKASSKAEGWMKSTKGMATASGVVVQVTTQQRNEDGSYAVAEALTFVPGASIITRGDAHFIK